MKICGNFLGQALLEYLIVLAFSMLFVTKFMGAFGEFAADGLGRFNVVLTLHLTTGLCQQDCWSGSYINGRTLE